VAKILFTGGGTAGHVTPNIALIEALSDQGWDCQYVGSRTGIERELISPLAIPYHAIYSGKLRRYFSWQNFIDPLFILLGILQSILICLRLRPNIVFSKGGFVAFPVVFSAWLCRIPVISHESDITPGLANKLCLPFSRVLCVNFPETIGYLAASLPPGRVRLTGSPLRAGLRHTNASRGRDFLGFDQTKPIVLVVGGSLGARVLNEVIWDNLPVMSEKYQVVHMVGAGNQREHDLQHDPGAYVQFDYLGDEYGDVLAAADMVVSRAGANSIFELLSFRKPHLLVPLTAAASRGDQLVNARVMGDAGMSLVLQESELGGDELLRALANLEDDSRWVLAMKSFPDTDAVQIIVELIGEIAQI
jgi:UDP-N-acetylglucosamine--N-acetylmuramyl-(pentapeptide) pyrophosphoryl-undecaprenol N-acetylglucosamine transferase